MIKVLLDNQSKFKKEARYIFETFFEIIGSPVDFIRNPQEVGEKDILIYYGRSPKAIKHAKIVIPESDWNSWEANTPEIKFIEDLPVIYMNDLTGKRLIEETSSPKNLIITFDIIAASFYFLSRQEEKVNKKRDIWGCFPEYFSLSHKWQITRTPVVNLYIEVLSSALKRFSTMGKRVFAPRARWKDNKKFAVALTHDVDNSRKYSLTNSARLMFRKIAKGEGDPKEIYEVLTKSLVGQKDQDPYWSLDDFVELESFFGGTSTFFIVSQSLNRKYDPFYALDSNISQQLRDISYKGWEIGLHGSYDSFENGDMLNKQKTKLEAVLKEPTIGTRQHYLRFSVDRTFSAQEKAGFVYDSTLGYNEDIGFRAGLAAPFYPFDSKERGRHNILELPLCIMDGSLFDFNRYTNEEAFGHMKALIDSVEDVGGLAVILWHTKARDEKRFPGWWDLYRRILEYLQSKDAWVTNASNISKWWVDRKQDVWNSRDN